MSVSAIPPGANPPPASFKPDLGQRRSDFQALARAVQSGDLAEAQRAFAALRQQIRNPTGSTGFVAVGNALDAGDITAAQAAFAVLQRDVQTVRFRQHHQPDHTGTVVPPPAPATQGVGATIDLKG